MLVAVRKRKMRRRRMNRRRTGEGWERTKLEIMGEIMMTKNLLSRIVLIKVGTKVMKC